MNGISLKHKVNFKLRIGNMDDKDLPKELIGQPIIVVVEDSDQATYILDSRLKC